MGKQSPLCIKCGNLMVRRTNRQNGNVFWGCSSYPKCTYTESVKNGEFTAENPIPQMSEKQVETVVLISCSKAKRTYPCESQLLYDASHLFSKSLRYAQTLSDEIYILSAKYGLIDLDTVIEPYDETLNDKSAEELSDWGKKVIEQLKQRADINNSTFVILAGKNYYNPIYSYLTNIKLPLLGLSIGDRLKKLDELLNVTPQYQSQGEMCLKLHKLFNAMPYFHGDMIDSIGFDNGIYVFFEKGETYQGINRIVRVGTHRSNNRLRARLKNHFIDKNKDGSIFRKNIGRAILNKYKSNYLDIWNIDSREKDLVMDLGNRYNSEFQQEIENEVSEFMYNNLYFICFPVESSEERLRLEEGIIATLNTVDDFTASPNWFGNYSSEHEIVDSGMWLKQGLDGTPLSEAECIKIEAYCSKSLETKISSNTSYREKVTQVPTPRKLSNGTREGSPDLEYNLFGKFTKTYAKFKEFCSEKLETKNETETSADSIYREKSIQVVASHQSNSGMKIKSSDIERYILDKFAKAKAVRETSVVVKSGNIHKELGLVSRMPTVCHVMYKLMERHDTIIHHQTPSGYSSTLEIEYFL